MLQSLKTWSILRREKPDLVLVASPPVFAAAAVWLYCKLTRSTYVIDAHTGVFDDPRWTWLSWLSRFLAKGACCTIVTGEHTQGIVQGWGGSTEIIGAIPLLMQDVVLPPLDSGPHVVVVNTFSQDEPVEEVLKAAELIPEVNFHVTGNVNHARVRIPQTLPPNLRFTSWLSEAEYAGLLHQANVIVCLTTHDHTMQRGAYEAMAVHKPLVTSDWPLLRQTFSKGTIHTENRASNIAASIQKAIANSEALIQDMRALSTEQQLTFAQSIERLEQKVADNSAL